MPDAAPRPDRAEAFVADLPDPPATALVVSVPHAGVDTAPYAAPLATGLDVRCDADLFVDRLYAGAATQAAGAGTVALVRARLSRFVCDLNRDPDDVSQAAVAGHPDPRNTDGRGFIWAVTTTGTPALARPLTLDEWRERRTLHAGYHAALASALAAARARFGFALLIDGHSMPSVGRRGHSDPGRPRADVVPGDRMGATCAPALSALVRGHFESAGLRVAMNDPYRGGFVVARHGRPSGGVHAIQIEMRRDLYMDEATYQPVPERMARLTDTLAGLIDALLRFDPRQEARRP